MIDSSIMVEYLFFAGLAVIFVALIAMVGFKLQLVLSPRDVGYMTSLGFVGGMLTMAAVLGNSEVVVLLFVLLVVLSALYLIRMGKRRSAERQRKLLAQQAAGRQ